MSKFKVTKRWEDIAEGNIGDLFCLLGKSESLAEECEEELDYAAKILTEENGIGFIIPDLIIHSEVSQTKSVFYNFGLGHYKGSGILLIKSFDIEHPGPSDNPIEFLIKQFINNRYTYILLKEPVILVKT
jgi:hypothetical protein